MRRGKRQRTNTNEDTRSRVDVINQDWCDSNMQTFMLPISHRRLTVLEVKKDIVLYASVIDSVCDSSPLKLGIE